MGSAPSKSKKTASPAEKDVSTQPEVKLNIVEPKKNGQDEIPDFNQTIALVKTTMTSLSSSEEFQESDTFSNLNYLVQTFYQLSPNHSEKLSQVCDTMIQNGLLECFVRMWDKFHEKTEEFYGDIQTEKFNIFMRMKVIFWNYSDQCVNLSKACYENKEVIDRLMREFTIPELGIECLKEHRIRHIVKATLGILHNCVRLFDKNRELIRLNDGITKLLEYNKSRYFIIKAKVFIVLAYCINEDENEKIMTSTGVITFIMKLLISAVESPNHVAKQYAFSAYETIAALNKLASNDDNKKTIVEADVLPLLQKMLDIENSTSQEHLETVNCVWALAFHPDNKQTIIDEPGLIDSIKALRANKISETRLKKACSSVLFVLGLEESSAEEVGGKQLATDKHIMISYNWDVQPIMFQLRDFLKEEGYNVWMDVDRIQDSILSAMADAVENSAIILVAMTEAYKNSNSCRTEAEYSYKRNVPVLPLLLQQEYVADGWLGAMVGTKLYINLSSGFTENKFIEVRQQLKKLLVTSTNNEKSIVPISHSAENPVTIKHAQPLGSKISSTRLTSVDGGGYALVKANIPCTTWSKSEVQEWCKTVGIKENGEKLLDCDGTALAQLCKMLLRSPESYYSLLRQDLHLEFKDVLILTSAIENILAN